MFLLVLVIIVLLINLKNASIHRFNELQEKINAISSRLAKLSEEQKKSFIKETVEREKIQSPETPAKITEEKASPQERPITHQGLEVKPEPKEKVIKKEEPAERDWKKLAEPSVVLAAAKQTEPKEVKKPGFFERNPDLEKFIGENLANKIGIGILVLGIGFFVKFAIDKEWINVYGRVFIGILCGGILVGLAHKLRKAFTAFSSVLVGGGIAVLYLTITIAFHEYQIIGQTAAFLIMVFITSFTILLSISYNRIELAILAILGGFGSPFMVSTGEGNYIVLFTYILILDAGMLILAYFKKWHPVNIIAYAFTILLFGSWLTTKLDGTNGEMIVGALIFATLFYFIFFAMNIANNLKERASFKALEISLLLSNTFLYYAAGMFILNTESVGIFKGLFTAFIGIFNFIFAFLLFRNTRVDRNLVFMLIGLVLTFISLAAPIQLEGNYITLFWAAETVLLLWLSQHSGIRLMKIASVVVMGLMWISLAMDWRNIYLTTDTHLTVIFNKGYITSLVALISICITFYLVKFEKQTDQQYLQSFKWILTFAGVLVLYLSTFLELNHQIGFYIDDPSARNIIIGTFNMLFILAIVLAEKRLDIPEKLKLLFGGWGVVAIVVYLLMYHSEIISARNGYLVGESSFLGFGFHYLLVGLLVVIAAWSVNRFRSMKEFNEYSYNIYSWFFVFFFLFLASAELDHTILLTLNTDAESIHPLIEQNHKIGYPILWGVASFILIAVGLKQKRRHLRIISLTLFLVTLLKLFLVDIRGISEGGKIAAFISLGIMLLIVSFMYQRLKKFLLADESNVSDTRLNNENQSSL
jgi:uncharacterized membrane protein